jgi:hypothetical protein
MNIPTEHCFTGLSMKSPNSANSIIRCVRSQSPCASLRPIMPTTLPCLIVNETRLKASNSRKLLVRLRARAKASRSVSGRSVIRRKRWTTSSNSITGVGFIHTYQQRYPSNYRADSCVPPVAVRNKPGLNTSERRNQVLVPCFRGGPPSRSGSRCPADNSDAGALSICFGVCPRGDQVVPVHTEVGGSPQHVGRSRGIPAPKRYPL